VVWVLLGVSLLRDKQNKPLYFIAQIEDISEIKLAMTRQQELTEKAQAAERARSDFLAVMSHEIRTPMSGVIGITEMLLDTGLNPEQRNLTETIRTSGESLLTIINDILDFSKIEAGQLSFEELDFDLRKVVEDTLEMMAGQAQAKGIELVGGVEPEVPTKLRDQSKIRSQANPRMAAAERMRSHRRGRIGDVASIGGRKHSIFGRDHRSANAGDGRSGSRPADQCRPTA